MVDDVMEWIGIVIIWIIAAMILLGGIALTVDIAQSIRTIDERFACEAANKEAVRKVFSTEVACRARNLGSDTLNIREIK